MNKIYKVIWSKTRNCYVAVSELAKSHTKSIAAARKKGTRFGRPPKPLDSQFESVVCQWQAKEISLAEALESLQASRSWFYKKIREKKSENIPL